MILKPTLKITMLREFEFRSSNPEERPPMYVCNCRAVRESRVLAVIQNGARTVDEVEAACGAGGDCGSCREEIDSLIEVHTRAQAAAGSASACANCPNAQRDNHASRAA